MVLLMKLETIEHARFRALAQITIDKEKGVEAFEEYMKIAFPYLAATKRREKQFHIDKLKQEVDRGALVVRPMAAPQLTSRISTARAAARAQPQSTAEEKRLYRKIGRSL